VQLSDSLKAYASIRDQVTFVGLGTKFQIWEPEQFRLRLEGARGRLSDLKQSLGQQWRTRARHKRGRPS
jgi:MraZ protein